MTLIAGIISYFQDDPSMDSNADTNMRADLILRLIFLERKNQYFLTLGIFLTPESNIFAHMWEPQNQYFFTQRTHISEP